MFGRLFPSERAAQPSELPAPPARWRGWSRRRMSEPMWKEGASEALIRAITISVCLSPAVRHPARSLSPHAPHPCRSIPDPFSWGTSLQICTHLHIFPSCQGYTRLARQLSRGWTLKTPASSVSKQLWISEGADICQHLFNKHNRNKCKRIGRRGKNTLLTESFSCYSRPTQSLIWYFIYCLAQLYSSLNLWTRKKWTVIAGCSLFS